MMECQKQNFNWRAWEMKQMRLPVGQEIVKDRAVIQAHLARLMRILAGNPHNQGEVK